MTRERADLGDLQTLRLRIDAVDREIVGLIAARSRLVDAVALHKPSAEAVRVPSRERMVMANARQSARAAGLDIGVIERIYHELLHAFCDYECQVLDT